jgi:hypothetical protein
MRGTGLATVTSVYGPHDKSAAIRQVPQRLLKALDFVILGLGALAIHAGALSGFFTLVLLSMLAMRNLDLQSKSR